MQKYNSHRERKDNAKGGVPLRGQNNGVLPEQTVRQTWLHYFNDYLRERNIITEEEWRKMRRLIG